MLRHHVMMGSSLLHQVHTAGSSLDTSGLGMGIVELARPGKLKLNTGAANERIARVNCQTLLNQLNTSIRCDRPIELRIARLTGRPPFTVKDTALYPPDTLTCPRLDKLSSWRRERPSLPRASHSGPTMARSTSACDKADLMCCRKSVPKGIFSMSMNTDLSPKCAIKRSTMRREIACESIDGRRQ